MKQILHIFRKDTRHFWLEILISLVVVILYCLHAPAQWRALLNAGRGLNLLQLSVVFMILVPLSWWLLIARLIHAESLVGESQFWITRPYEWSKLLAAKVLFVVVWICLPFLLGQSLVLADAGFHPLSYTSGFLTDLVIVTAVFILPLIALAAVTANFARMTMTILGGGVLAAVISFTVSYYSHGYSSSNPYHDSFLIPLLLCGCAAVVVVQYATRRVWVARALLLLVPLAAAGLAAAYSRDSLVDRAYSRPGAASVPDVLVSIVDNHSTASSHSSSGDDFIDIAIQYSGVAEGYVVFADNFRFTLIGADGSQWTSPWQGFNDRIRPGSRRSYLSLKVAPAIFERFRSAPVTLQVTFALTRLQAEQASTMPFPDRDAAVPGIGFCAPGAQIGDQQWAALICRSAIRQPQLTYVTADWWNIPCSEPLSKPQGVQRGGAWIGSVDPGNLEVSISSVPPATVLLFHDSRTRYEGNGQDQHICSGTPLTITQYHVVDRTQTDLTIPNLQIPAIKFRN